MDILDFLKKQESNLKEIKKSLYRRVADETKETAKEIVADIADKDNIPEVPEDKKPAVRQSVMLKAKGVHKPYMSSGESLAGELAREGKKKPRSANIDVSKKLHSKKLKELKEIKPNLPKSEGFHPSELMNKEKMISTPKKEMVDEHKHLVRVLESKSHKDDKIEAKKQAKELKEYMRKGLDNLKEFLIKNEQKQKIKKK